MKLPAFMKKLFARAPSARGQRMFGAARPSRMNDGWSTAITSADGESVTSRATLAARSRALIRDNAHAKRARDLIVTNIIGSGIGMQAALSNNRGRLLEEINEPIEEAWQKWCCADNCHIAGRLAFADIERLLIAECFEAGDVFVRIHRTGRGDVPISLEIIEAERLATEWEAPNYLGHLVREGVEVDDYNTPVAYWIHRWHPGDPRRQIEPDMLMRVPAEEIIHLAKIDRWPQTRGVPWMHAGMQRLYQLGEYQDAAVIAARIGAEKVMVLKESEQGGLAEALGKENNDGQLAWSSSKGQVDILPTGTDIANWTPNYPEVNYAPFVNAALRDISAAFGVSYESLSRDYSQSNYSSSRLALLDDRAGWRVLQQWYIRSFRERLHKIWLEAAVYSRAISAIPVADYVLRRDRFEAVTWKPRGWSWVDPTKEVTAYKEAVRCGFTTVADVIAQTGSGTDLEDVLEGRRQELMMIAEAGLEFDTDPGMTAPAPGASFTRPAAPSDAADPPQPEDTADAATKAAVVVGITRKTA